MIVPESTELLREAVRRLRLRYSHPTPEQRLETRTHTGRPNAQLLALQKKARG